MIPSELDTQVARAAHRLTMVTYNGTLTLVIAASVIGLGVGIHTLIVLADKCSWVKLRRA